MRIALLLLFLAGLTAPLWAQDDYARKRDEKLKENWLTQARWITDYDKARSVAKKTGKLIFTYFTRSYTY
ncbi:MAG: hypothetical protein HYU64_03745 [Armatimonadetes bacterium]|nr:hypothetical protein [Armatimonadota bacterium]